MKTRLAAILLLASCCCFMTQAATLADQESSTQKFPQTTAEEPSRTEPRTEPQTETQAEPRTETRTESQTTTHSSPQTTTHPSLQTTTPDAPQYYNPLIPENRAVVAGERTSLTCSSDDGASNLTWVWVDTTGPQETVLVSKCEVNPDYAHLYGLENVGRGRCDLVVLNASVTEAGTYRCTKCDGFDPANSAQLVVLGGGGLICKLNNLEPHVNDVITLTCDISYTINFSPIQIVCTDVLDRTIASSTGTSSAGRTTLSYKFTVLSTHVTLPQYTCTARFTAAGSLPSTDTTLPDLDFTWTSPASSVSKVELWRPRNEWGYVGGSVTLFCRRSTQQVVWTFVQYGSTHSVVVSSGCSGSRILAGYRVDTSGGAYLLIIDRLTLAHAGTYTCQDLTSSLLPVAAKLVVLDGVPQCAANPALNVKPGFAVQFACSVSYAGNYAPVFKWTDEKDAVLASSTTTTSGGRVESSVSVVAVDFSQLVTATAQFDEPKETMSDLVESDTGAPNYTYAWSSSLMTTVHMTDLGDCGVIKKDNSSAKSGMYFILVEGSQTRMEVYCDMDTDRGGWTVFQRRMDGSESFYRNWAAYQSGFGKRDGEFWLGNDNLAALTNSKTYVLRIDLGDWSKNLRYAQYSSFRVMGAANRYQVSALGTNSGTAGNSMGSGCAYPILNMRFSTYDQDTSNKMATNYRGGWWYNTGLHANLNGEYNNTKSNQGITWTHWMAATYSLKSSEMKLRPSNY